MVMQTELDEGLCALMSGPYSFSVPRELMRDRQYLSICCNTNVEMYQSTLP